MEHVEEEAAAEDVLVRPPSDPSLLLPQPSVKETVAIFLRVKPVTDLSDSAGKLCFLSPSNSFLNIHYRILT